MESLKEFERTLKDVKKPFIKSSARIQDFTKDLMNCSKNTAADRVDNFKKLLIYIFENHINPVTVQKPPDGINYSEVSLLLYTRMYRYLTKHMYIFFQYDKNGKLRVSWNIPLAFFPIMCASIVSVESMKKATMPIKEFFSVFDDTLTKALNMNYNNKTILTPQEQEIIHNHSREWTYEIWGRNYLCTLEDTLSVLSDTTQNKHFLLSFVNPLNRLFQNYVLCPSPANKHLVTLLNYYLKEYRKYKENVDNELKPFELKAERNYIENYIEHITKHTNHICTSTEDYFNKHRVSDKYDLAIDNYADYHNLCLTWLKPFQPIEATVEIPVTYNRIEMDFKTFYNGLLRLEEIQQAIKNGILSFSKNNLNIRITNFVYLFAKTSQDIIATTGSFLKNVEFISSDKMQNSMNAELAQKKLYQYTNDLNSSVRRFTERLDKNYWSLPPVFSIREVGIDLPKQFPYPPYSKSQLMEMIPLLIPEISKEVTLLLLDKISNTALDEPSFIWFLHYLDKTYYQIKSKEV